MGDEVKRCPITKNPIGTDTVCIDCEDMSDRARASRLQARVEELEQVVDSLNLEVCHLESQLAASNARLEGVREWVERHRKVTGSGGTIVGATALLRFLDTPQPARPDKCETCPERARWEGLRQHLVDENHKAERDYADARRAEPMHTNTMNDMERRGVVLRQILAKMDETEGNDDA